MTDSHCKYVHNEFNQIAIAFSAHFTDFLSLFLFGRHPFQQKILAISTRHVLIAKPKCSVLIPDILCNWLVRPKDSPFANNLELNEHFCKHSRFKFMHIYFSNVTKTTTIQFIMMLHNLCAVPLVQHCNSCNSELHHRSDSSEKQAITHAFSGPFFAP